MAGRLPAVEGSIACGLEVGRGVRWGGGMPGGRGLGGRGLGGGMLLPGIHNLLQTQTHVCNGQYTAILQVEPYNYLGNLVLMLESGSYYCCARQMQVMAIVMAIVVSTSVERDELRQKPTLANILSPPHTHYFLYS